MKEPLNLWVTSDIHLGHANTPTADIIRRFNNLITYNPEFIDCDIFFIAGDAFDRLLTVPDPNITYIELWVAKLLKACRDNAVKLRILEGTPSHDWKQSNIFIRLQRLLNIDLDLKYVNILDIEYISEFDIHVLYIPDEWNIDTEDTWVDVQRALDYRKLKEVDVTIMHGCFPFQLPDGVKASTHSVERYSAITKHLLFIGHIHFPSFTDKIIAPGSFDRLAHGEERSKGFVKAKIRGSGSHDLTFVENEEAQTYRTLDLTNKSLKSSVKYLVNFCKHIKVYDTPTFIRVIASRNDTILEAIKNLKIEFPYIKFSTKYSQDVLKVNELPETPRQYIPVAITAENIDRIIEDKLKNKFYSELDIRKSLEILNAYSRT